MTSSDAKSIAGLLKLPLLADSKTPALLAEEHRRAIQRDLMGSCPRAWCRSGAPEQGWLRDQAATVGRLTGTVSLSVPSVSRLI